MMNGYFHARTTGWAMALALAIGAASPARAQDPDPTQGAGQGPAPGAGQGATPASGQGTGQGTEQTGGQGGPDPTIAEPDTTMQIYGFAMMDMGYQGEQNDPLWYDVLRPTKLPAFRHEFGRDNRWFQGIRQSRFGVKTTTPTSLGEFRTTFEFDLFGVGPDAGQTTIRMRDVYGDLGHFLAGQADSPFMDGSTFPNILEYWGPNGMVYFKNVQFRYTPWHGDNEVEVAIERPGASGDAGIFASRIELQNVQGRFPVPDLSAHYRATRGWGHVQVAGILRLMRWDDLLEDPFDLSGHAWGWGINTTSNLKLGSDTVHLGVVFGEGVENYMNDAPIDVGTRVNPGNRRSPVVGEALPLVGMLAFYDRTWNDHWTSSAGYSRLDIDTSSGQLPLDFKTGQYAIGNLLYLPVPNVMMGGEFQWGRRDNNSDGFSSHDYRVQFSFKYNFDYKLGGK